MKQYLEPLLIGVALMLYGLRPQLGTQPLVLALSSLAMVYHLNAFRRTPRPADAPPPPFFSGVLLPKVTGVSAAAAVVGILFYLMHWEGAAPILLVGGSTLLLAGALSLSAYLSGRQPQLLAGLVRAVVIGGLAIFLFTKLPPVPGPAQRAPTAQTSPR